MSDRLARRLLLAGAVSLSGCSVLPQPAYPKRTDWPLVVPPPEFTRPTRAGRKTLTILGFQAAPSLAQRGLQWLNPDGSIHVDFYNQWNVLPSQGMDEIARRWLLASGLFAAVFGPESGLPADLALQGELVSLLANPQRRLGHAAIFITLLGQQSAPQRVLTQRTLSGNGRMPTDTPAGVVDADRGAIAVCMRELITTLRPYA